MMLSGGRRSGALLLRLRLPRAAASSTQQRLYASEAPRKSPFEIHFHPTAEDALFNRKHPAASAHTAHDDAELESDIHSLHAEMAGIFGEEPEEYDDGGSSTTSSKIGDAVASKQPPATAFIDGALTSNAAWGQQSHPQERYSKPTPRINSQSASDGILLLQGPCSYLRDTVIGYVRKGTRATVVGLISDVDSVLVRICSSNKRKHELLRELHEAAAEIGTSVRCRDSNLEGDILEWLLSADAGSSIVLCWNSAFMWCRFLSGVWVKPGREPTDNPLLDLGFLLTCGRPLERLATRAPRARGS